MHEDPLLSMEKNPNFKKQVSERSEQLRTELHQAFATYKSFLHPKVLEASRSLDRQILEWIRAPRA